MKLIKKFLGGGMSPYDLDEVEVTPETNGVGINTLISNKSKLVPRVKIPNLTPSISMVSYNDTQHSVRPLINKSSELPWYLPRLAHKPLLLNIVPQLNNVLILLPSILDLNTNSEVTTEEPVKYRDASEIGNSENWVKNKNDYNPEDIYNYLVNYYRLSTHPERLSKLVGAGLNGGYGSNFVEYIKNKHLKEAELYYSSPNYKYNLLINPYKNKFTFIGFGGLESPYFSEANNAIYYNPNNLEQLEDVRALINTNLK